MHDGIPSIETRARRDLVTTAKAMLAGEVDLLEGVRRIYALRFNVGGTEDLFFADHRH